MLAIELMNAKLIPVAWAPSLKNLGVQHEKMEVFIIESVFFKMNANQRTNS